MQVANPSKSEASAYGTRAEQHWVFTQPRQLESPAVAQHTHASAQESRWQVSSPA
jgi:hypothetical protein